MQQNQQTLNYPEQNKNLYLIYSTNLYKVLYNAHQNRITYHESYRYSASQNNFLKTNPPRLNKCIHLYCKSDYEAIKAFSSRLKDITKRKYVDKSELKAMKKLKHLEKYFPELII